MRAATLFLDMCDWQSPKTELKPIGLDEDSDNASSDTPPFTIKAKPKSPITVDVGTNANLPFSNILDALRKIEIDLDPHQEGFLANTVESLYSDINGEVGLKDQVDEIRKILIEMDKKICVVKNQIYFFFHAFLILIASALFVFV